MKYVKQHQAPTKKLIVTMPPGVLHKMQLICVSMALETRATVWLQDPLEPCWREARDRRAAPGRPVPRPQPQMGIHPCIFLNCVSSSHPSSEFLGIYAGVASLGDETYLGRGTG